MFVAPLLLLQLQVASPPPTITCTIINGDQLSGRVVFLRRTRVRIVHHTLGLVTMRVKDLKGCESDDPAIQRRLITLTLRTVPPLITTAGEPIDVPPWEIQQVTEVPMAPKQNTIQTVVMPIAAEQTLPLAVERIGWKRTLDVNYGLSRGNSNASDMRFVGGAARRSTRSQIAITATRRIGRRNGDAAVDFFQATLRYDQALGKNDAGAADRPSFFSETIYERDPFAKLERRVLENTGISIPISEVIASNLAVEIGAGITHEKFQGRDASTRMGALVRLAAKQRFKTARADQQIATFPDFTGQSVRYRFTTNANLSSPLTKRLSLRLGFVNRYDTRPRTAVKKSDTSIQTGLGIEF